MARSVKDQFPTARYVASSIAEYDNGDFRTLEGVYDADGRLLRKPFGSADHESEPDTGFDARVEESLNEIGWRNLEYWPETQPDWTPGGCNLTDLDAPVEGLSRR